MALRELKRRLKADFVAKGHKPTGWRKHSDDTMLERLYCEQCGDYVHLHWWYYGAFTVDRKAFEDSCEFMEVTPAEEPTK